MRIDISTLKYRYVITGLIWFFSILLPGYLFLFIFRGDFFIYLNFFTLSMLALCITSPVLLTNTTLFMLIYRNKEINDDSRFSNALFKAEIVSTMIVYIAIILGFVFDWRARSGVLTIIGCQLLLMIYFGITYYQNKSIEKTKPHRPL
ncbi:MAG: hypothetical protein ACFCUU_12645 [Cyclobacteriaceae bacterium]